MATKRIFKDAKNGVEISNPHKRHKSNRAGSDCDSTKHEYKLTVDESMLVQQLQDIVDQVVHRPQVLHNIPEGSEILKVTTQLHAALAAAIKRNPDTKHRKSKATKPTAQPVSLPDLPSIHNASLERAVFTHPGARVNFAPEGMEQNYDRLEVLGDAYVEVIATRLIWDQFKDMPAGRMSQVREDLVKNETLAGFASQYGFDKRVSVSVPEEQKAQSKRWLKIRGDVFEAYVAAVILSSPDHGFDMVEQWLRELWLPRLSHVQPVQTVLRYKEQLAKKVMSKGIKLRYVEEQPAKQLDGGMQTYYIGVYLTGWGWQDQHLGSGSGLNKAIAGDEAANRALQNSPLIDQVAAAKVAHDRQASGVKEVDRSNTQLSE
ncbi:nucleolar RNAse [Talaromyces pinophilus]|uniref:Nucleolar RNAse n=1 Tax=Talaromyces pinophilus TaxID=128442 RepID=A0A6N4SLN3_TALPI|nr:Double-strand-specific pac1 ribonuclease [Talaromyces pinophilus]GAM40631.1 nucleolar RNAse [Talaromyces pinophilus]